MKVENDKASCRKPEGVSHESCALKTAALVIRADFENVSARSFESDCAWSGANTMSIIQLLKALAFGARMLCNLVELAVTICITRTLQLCLCLSVYLLPCGGRSTRALCCSKSVSATMWKYFITAVPFMELRQSLKWNRLRWSDVATTGHCVFIRGHKPNRFGATALIFSNVL